MIYQEKIFTKEECDIIKNYHKKYTDLKGWFPEKNLDGQRIKHPKKLMSYDVFLILNNEETKWVFSKLMKWFSNTTGIKLNEKNEITHCTLHKYNVGDRFAKHIDLYDGHESRRYNIGIQLNDTYEGGEYVCWDDNGEEILISKEQGTVLSYHCRIEHEIKEITKGERWSIVMPIHTHNIIENKNIL